MAVHVLIITPTTGFGELIRETLRDDGQYQPVLVSTGEDAIGYATQTPFSLAIIDADLEDVHPASLARSLRKIIPNIHLIIFPPESGEGLTALDEVSPDAYMEKPFYLPDLAETAARVLGLSKESTGETDQPTLPTSVEHKTPPLENNQLPSNTFSSGKQTQFNSKSPASQLAPPWLEDVSRAAQYLTRLSLETAAQAALISRSGQLWAYAGQLSQPAANELAQAVSQFWNDDGNSDLARFIRLDATGEELMLYATSLGADLVLALAFEAETPFSKIRAQAGHLARSLSTPPGIGSEPDFNKGIILENIHPQDSVIINQSNITPCIESPSIIAISDSPPPEKGLADLPISSRSSDEVSLPHGKLPTSNNNPHPMLDSFLVDLPSTSKQGKEKQVTPAVLSQGDDFNRIQTESNSAPALQEDAQPFSHMGKRLTYTFLMIPRMPEHLIKGDLLQYLSEWTPQLCMAFGWRLEHILIHTDYFLWIISVGPKVSPGNIIKKIRNNLSQRILDEFPRLAKENPSEDFWAPDYLVYNGSQSPLNQVIEDFITQTRMQQGVSR